MKFTAKTRLSVEPADCVCSPLSLAVLVPREKILACYDTPIEIIPAPGAGKFIVLLADSWEYIPGGTGYTINIGVDLYYSNDFDNGISGCSPNDLLAGTSYGIRSSASASGYGRPALNSSVVLHQNGNNPTNGDGRLIIYVDYLVKTSLA